ncbi:MAG: type II toxin-antitoxin system VapC family toxin [Bacteroidetes bacterium]|nr:type II toxin-antitoxin system VapC family toxin [Bacteroidota bacterium]
MNGNSFLLDTNVVLYLLSGNKTITAILDGAQPYVSFITQLELIGYKGITPKDIKLVKSFLNECIIVDINEEIKEHTISIRQKHQLKLPDSIIAGTAHFWEIPLLTADKVFSKISSLNLALYEE